MTAYLISLTLLICAVILIRALFRRKIAPRYLYAIWLAVIIRAVIPISLYYPDLSFLLPPDAPDSEAVTSLESDSAESVFSDSTIGDMADAPETVIASAPIVISTEPLPELRSPEFSTTTPAEKQTVSPEPEPESRRSDIKKTLCIIWAAGSVSVLTFFAVSRLYLEIQLRHSRVSCGRYRNIRVYRSPKARTSCLAGIIPAIYLTDEAGTSEYRSMILMHEYCHYRHLDFLWNIIRVIFLSAFWWNPAVWAGVVLSQHDSELASDDAAAERLGKENRLRYAHAIIDSIPQKKSFVPAIGGSPIHERINYMTEKRRYSRLAAIPALLLVISMLGCSFAGQKEPDGSTNDEPLISAQSDSESENKEDITSETDTTYTETAEEDDRPEYYKITLPLDTEKSEKLVYAGFCGDSGSFTVLDTIHAGEDGVRYEIYGVGADYKTDGDFTELHTYRVTSENSRIAEVAETETITKELLLAEAAPYNNMPEGEYYCKSYCRGYGLIGRLITIGKDGFIKISSYLDGTDAGGEYEGRYTYDTATGDFSAELTFSMWSEGEKTTQGPKTVSGMLLTYNGFVGFVCEESGFSDISPDDPLPLLFYPGLNSGIVLPESKPYEGYCDLYDYFLTDTEENKFAYIQLLPEIKTISLYFGIYESEWLNRYQGKFEYIEETGKYTSELYEIGDDDNVLERIEFFGHVSNDGMMEFTAVSCSMEEYHFLVGKTIIFSDTQKHLKSPVQIPADKTYGPDEQQTTDTLIPGELRVLNNDAGFNIKAVSLGLGKNERYAYYRYDDRYVFYITFIQPGYSDVTLCILDTKEGRITDRFKLADTKEGMYDMFGDIDGCRLVSWYRDDNTGAEVFCSGYKVTENNGSFSLEEISSESIYPNISLPVRSPDGKQMAYFRMTDGWGNGAVYLRKSDGTEKKIVDNIVYSSDEPIDVQSVRGYTPVGFIDNTHLVLNIGGWEWGIGRGVYDTETEKLTLYEDGIMAIWNPGTMLGEKSNDYFDISYYILDDIAYPKHLTDISTDSDTAYGPQITLGDAICQCSYNEALNAADYQIHDYSSGSDLCSEILCGILLDPGPYSECQLFKYGKTITIMMSTPNE